MVLEHVRALADEHRYNLDHDPTAAHWNAAAAATFLGLALTAVRSSIVAFMSPPSVRLRVFGAMFRSVAPLYCIPFTLGSQYDCYRAVWERRGAPAAPVSHHAADLG
jgi:hypothetical protein